MPNVTIAALHLNHDMRSGLHAISDEAHRELKPATANLYINRRRTIARLVDHLGGVHTYWTTPAEPFNEPLLVQLFNSAIGLVLHNVDFTTAHGRRRRRRNRKAA